MSFHLAFLPYYLLIGVVVIATLIPPVARLLHAVHLSLVTPKTVTGLGWVTPEASATLQITGHPGALILYAAALTAMVFTCLGYRPSWRVVWRGAADQGIPTTVTILALVGVATVMVYSGMTSLLAAAAAGAAGRLFPLFAPFIGALGTVITGSNTNSNVLFGALQRDAAHLLKIDPVLTAALQSAGGALGSMVAPAKVVLATATTGLAGREGQVMHITGRYVLVLTAVLGLIGLVWSIR
ncbi:MAG: L-lactate permease [Armatimonadota bacterium]|nr:L-lactate permease [Armatimonadota bacterium]MDR7452768.1 L-lactate permease [Armatimonadota bacterium]MDR7494580.1 L-lactate permease [Armatimonadota bacterium]MDR7505935.1 L-lactate permease [Armatimonadota bacterium]MDR7548179.1 L-lactate permease [Armatimonadota bacterium]